MERIGKELRKKSQFILKKINSPVSKCLATTEDRLGNPANLLHESLAKYQPTVFLMPILNLLADCQPNQYNLVLSAIEIMQSFQFKVRTALFQLSKLSRGHKNNNLSLLRN